MNDVRLRDLEKQIRAGKTPLDAYLPELERVDYYADAVITWYELGGVFVKEFGPGFLIADYFDDYIWQFNYEPTSADDRPNLWEIYDSLVAISGLKSPVAPKNKADAYRRLFFDCLKRGFPTKTRVYLDGADLNLREGSCPITGDASGLLTEQAACGLFRDTLANVQAVFGMPLYLYAARWARSVMAEEGVVWFRKSDDTNEGLELIIGPRDNYYPCPLVRD